MYVLKNINCKYGSTHGEIANGYFEIKKSKFYSYIFSVSDKNKVDEYLKNIRKEHKKARHIVYAYEYYNDGVKYVKFSNDNEPQGTGVNSIIASLNHENVTNYLVIVVRYFGGTLLGTGPLLRSYLTSFKEAFLKCTKEDLL